MTVFVVQEQPRFDYSCAEAFGEICFITDVEFSDTRSSLRNDRIVESLKEAVKKFDPDRDCVILTGNPILMGYAFHMFFTKAGYLRVLKFNRETRSYKQVLFAPDRELEVTHVK